MGSKLIECPTIQNKILLEKLEFYQLIILWKGIILGKRSTFFPTKWQCASEACGAKRGL
jgi:hypothetical protein